MLDVINYGDPISLISFIALLVAALISFVILMVVDRCENQRTAEPIKEPEEQPTAARTCDICAHYNVCMFEDDGIRTAKTCPDFLRCDDMKNN